MRRISRRRVLAGVTGSALLAGCVTDSSSPTSNNPTETEQEHPAACPEYDRVEQVICYNAVDPAAVDGVLEPSDRVLSPGASISFTLRNQSDRRLGTNFYNWQVHKYVDGDWYHIAPGPVPQPSMSIPPGESHTWTVRVDNSRNPGKSTTESVTLHGFGGGKYAFRGRGWFEDQSHEEAIAFAATFEFDADPLELTPTDAIENVEWEGETLVARSTRGDPDREDARLGAYELERIETTANEFDRVITEQVFRDEHLRDVLALSREYDAAHVRLEEFNSRDPIFGSRTDGFFTYDGELYDVTTRELE